MEKQNKTIQILASYVHVPQAKKLFNYKFALIVAKLIFCHFPRKFAKNQFK